MNLLRKEMAPISAEAWKEIEDLAKETLAATLSGRKFVDIDGPHGIAYASVPMGRLELGKKTSDGTPGYGIHKVLPLVETRIPFSVQSWELDNIDRGAKDSELDSLVKACREAALFEEKAIYKGFKEASIEGIEKAASDQILDMKLNTESIIETLAEAQTQLLKAGVEGGADLVVPLKLWKYLARSTPGGSLKNIVERQIQGKVIYSEVPENALLVANRGEDLELSIGQDFAIGYHSHSASEVNLFLTESFTFRVISPEAVIGFKLS